MVKLTKLAESKCYKGKQYVFSHESEFCACEMTFGIYVPETARTSTIPLIWFLSGLTCTHENAMVKSGIQSWASEKEVAVIFPDTSPRGDGVPDDSSFDLGQGAGFYVDSKIPPWEKNFQMWSYILKELPEIIFTEFPLNKDKQSIMGHSMGGLGALNMAFRNPNIFKSVSAFAPISNPTQGIWGGKQFEAYLGDDNELWKDYDPSILLEKRGYPGKILIDQGTKDDFLDNLMPQALAKQIESRNEGDLFRFQEGFDHSYFFFFFFVKDHIFWHEKALNS